MISWLLFNIGLLIVAYLLGSMATGYWVGSWFYGIDIRECGSGSTGATNVLRNIGKFPALIVLIIDILKGVLAIALVRYVYSLDAVQQLAAAVQTSDFANLLNFLALGLGDAANLQPWMVTLAGLGAAIGHSKSIWIGFKGGKAVATSLGILLAMSWQVGLGTLGVFALVLAISRIVSLSSIVGAIAVSALMYFAGEPLAYQIFAIAGGIFVIWRHRTNIERLLAGTEPRIGQKLSAES
jgi:glycerol-3-phosphate acyltransferase PlsY